jgi:hypothetical protein
MKTSTQTTGNIGLYYTCYQLSLLGWNVMPTARNAKGIDIVAYSQTGKRRLLIQVKTLSKTNPVPLGSTLSTLIADFIVVCVRVRDKEPECFILTPKEIGSGVRTGHKDGKTSHWLKIKSYYKNQFRNKWDRIGFGYGENAA